MFFFRQEHHFQSIELQNLIQKIQMLRGIENALQVELFSLEEKLSESLKLVENNKPKTKSKIIQNEIEGIRCVSSLVFEFAKTSVSFFDDISSNGYIKEERNESLLNDEISSMFELSNNNKSCSFDTFSASEILDPHTQKSYINNINEDAFELNIRSAAVCFVEKVC